jgi:hypothetical protein
MTDDDDDDVGPQIIIVWSRHSVRVLKSEMSSLRLSFPS